MQRGVGFAFTNPSTFMKKSILLALIVSAFLASCKQVPTTKPAASLLPDSVSLVASYPLSDASRLNLYQGLRDEVSSTYVVLTDDNGNLDEAIAMGNKNFCRRDDGSLLFDTVQFVKGVDAYVLHTYDISSTYGSEFWYVLYPYYGESAQQGPWALARLPYDILRLDDLDGDGTTEVIGYTDKWRGDSTCYRFDQGLLMPF